MIPSQLLRFDGTQNRSTDVDAWFASRSGELGDIAQEWFTVMRSCGDEVRELLHDGCPVACFGNAPFAYVNVFSTHANVGFFQGASLPDPERLLQGAGKFMRHVKLRPGEPMHTVALHLLIRTAYEQMKSFVEHG